MKKTATLTKVCSNCGLEKPISAFLQMSGPEGAHYGNICSTCRKEHAEKTEPAKESDESTTTNLGKKLDANEKVQAEKDKRELRQHLEELFEEEGEKLEKEKLEKKFKTEHIAKEERQHRESFLKKSSFLSSTADKADASKIFESRQRNEKVTLEHTKGQEQAAKEEQKLKSDDLSAPFLPSQTGALLKRGLAFRELMARLGSSAPAGSLFNKGEAAKGPGAESVSEIIQKKWGPKK